MINDKIAMTPAEAVAFAAGMLRDSEKAVTRFPSEINRLILAKCREEYETALDVYETFRVSNLGEQP